MDEQVIEEQVEAPTGTAEEVLEVSEEDVPLQWMGVDLSDLPAEARQSVIDEFKQQESYIGKLQRQLKEREEAEPQAEPAPIFAEDVVPPTDDEIMAAFGYDTNASDYELTKQFVLPMARQNLMLLGQVDQMSQSLQAEQAWDNWNATLDNMETQYGELPVDRDAVVEFAVSQGIQDPEVAYYRLAMQSQKMTADAAQKQRLQRLEDVRDRKRQTVGVRPTSSRPPTEGTSVTPSGNIAEDIKRAASEAAKELGLSWDDAAQRFLDRS